jgi:hypothetical protein
VTLDTFKRACNFSSLLETEKVCHLAFFYLKTSAMQSFDIADVAQWLTNAGGANPNRHRLAEKLRAARDTVKEGQGWRLSVKFVETLESKFPELGQKSQEVLDHGTILPEVLYEKTRGYIVNLAKQINRAYEENIFDGCAVLLRRLEEVLLIMAYQKLGIDDAIKDASGNYKMLEAIVVNAQANQTLALGRNGKQTIEKIREMGNYSAHQITYQCRREFIQEKIEEYRALVNELLHKAGLR